MVAMANGTAGAGVAGSEDKGKRKNGGDRDETQAGTSQKRPSTRQRRWPSVDGHHQPSGIDQRPSRKSRSESTASSPACGLDTQPALPPVLLGGEVNPGETDRHAYTYAQDSSGHGLPKRQDASLAAGGSRSGKTASAGRGGGRDIGLVPAAEGGGGGAGEAGAYSRRGRACAGACEEPGAARRMSGKHSGEDSCGGRERRDPRGRAWGNDGAAEHASTTRSQASTRASPEHRSITKARGDDEARGVAGAGKRAREAGGGHARGAGGGAVEAAGAVVTLWQRAEERMMQQECLVCVCVCLYACMCVCVCVCMDIHDIVVHGSSIHVYTSIHILCVCVCMYGHT